MATTPCPPPEDDVPAPQEQEQPGASDQETNASTYSAAASKKKKKRKKKKGGVGGGSSPQAASTCTYGDQRDTFRLKQDAVAGRCVVASRNLEAGELVLEEPPVAKVMLNEVYRSSKRGISKSYPVVITPQVYAFRVCCLVLLALRKSVSTERHQ